MAAVKSVTIFDEFPNGTKVERRYEVTITTNSLIDEVYVLSPVVVDASDDGSIYGAKKLASLADIESGSGADILAEYQDQPDYDRRALGKAMVGPGIEEFHAVLPLFKSMEGRGGANANQRANYLGVTTISYRDMANRFGDDEGVAFFIEDHKNQVWPEIPAGWE